MENQENENKNYFVIRVGTPFKDSYKSILKSEMLINSDIFILNVFTNTLEITSVTKEDYIQLTEI